MKAIVAVNNLGFIGLDDKLLWYNKEDLKHFKTSQMVPHYWWDIEPHKLYHHLEIEL